MSTRDKQKIVIIIYCTLVALALLFPPWGFDDGNEGLYFEQMQFFISSKTIGNILWKLLAIEIVVLSCIGVAAFLLCNYGSNSEKSD